MGTIVYRVTSQGLYLLGHDATTKLPNNYVPNADHQICMWSSYKSKSLSPALCRIFIFSSLHHFLRCSMFFSRISLAVATTLVTTSNADIHQLIVGTFRTESLYTLEFDDVAFNLSLVQNLSTNAASSWLTLSVCNCTFVNFDVEFNSFHSMIRGICMAIHLTPLYHHSLGIHSIVRPTSSTT